MIQLFRQLCFSALLFLLAPVAHAEDMEQVREEHCPEPPFIQDLCGYAPGWSNKKEEPYCCPEPYVMQDVCSYAPQRCNNLWLKWTC